MQAEGNEDPRVVAFNAAYHAFREPYRRLAQARASYWVPYDMLMQFSSFSAEQCAAVPQYALFNVINERARPLCEHLWRTSQPFRMSELLEMSANTIMVSKQHFLEYVIDKRLTRIYDLMYYEMRPLFQDHDYQQLAQYDIRGFLQEIDDFLASDSTLHPVDLMALNRENLFQYAQAVAAWRAQREPHLPTIMRRMETLPPELRTHIARQAILTPRHSHTRSTTFEPLPSPFEPLL
jgi:hypothetical protein